MPGSEAEIVLEVLGSARSMRWLTDDPVSPDLVERIVWAGTRASSPRNSQAWDFVVITSPEIKRRLQQAIAAAWRRSQTPPLPSDPTDRRTFLGAQNVVDNLHRAPAIIVVCGANVYPPGNPRTELARSAVYAAAQNMLVAARALGLGAAYTTFHTFAEPEVREILEIPEDRFVGVTMPLGWPARAFGPVTRRPVAEVLHRDVW